MSSICALEGEVSSSREVTSLKNEELMRVPSANEELRTWWEQAMTANASLRSQLLTTEASCQQRLTPDPDANMRSDDESSLRAELTSCLARAQMWSEEVRTSKAEVHYIINESLTFKILSSEELSLTKEECRKTDFEIKDMAAHLSVSQTRSTTMENILSDWKEECRSVVHKSRDKEDRCEAEMVTMKS